MDDRKAKRAEIAERDLAALRWWQAEAERGAEVGGLGGVVVLHLLEQAHQGHAVELERHGRGLDL